MTDKAGLAHVIREQALAWHWRLRHADQADRHAFAAWLAQDPAHRTIYDQVAARDPHPDTAQLPFGGGPDFKPVPLPANDVDDGPESPHSIAIHWLVMAAIVLIGMLVMA